MREAADDLPGQFTHVNRRVRLARMRKPRSGSDGRAETGDAIVVPAGVEFELANAGAVPLRLVCCLPVGGQGVIGDGAPFTPPWAE